MDLIADWDTYFYKESTYNAELDVDIDIPDCWHDISGYVNVYDGYITRNIKVGLPKHLSNIKHNQFFDLDTLFKLKDIEIENKIDFSLRNPITLSIPPHPFYKSEIQDTDLYDAYINYLCYKKLMY